MEFFYKTQTPPWKVPKKRKSRGRPTRFTRLNMIKEKGEEVITQNRFGLLSHLPISMNEYNAESEHEDFKNAEVSKFEIPETEKRSPEYSPESYKFINNVSSFSEFDSFNNFMYYCNYSRENDTNVSNNFIMYDNNKHRCSGYFPDFIIPEDFSHSQFSYNKYNPYYFYKKDNSYLKYLAKNNGKYDTQYYKDMYFAYRVGRKYYSQKYLGYPHDNNSYHDLKIPRDSEAGISGNTQVLYPQCHIDPPCSKQLPCLP